jgi:hypothetical protein
MYVYEPLQRHIAAAISPHLTMTYEQVEKVLGRPLPPSAHKDRVKRQWWANTDTHSQAKAWLSNGRKAKLDVKKNAVTFYFRDDRPAEATAPRGSAPGEIRVPISKLHPSAMRLLEDFAEETGIDLDGAASTMLNQMALRRRRETLDWFAQNTVMSEQSSSELIRSDRDGR